MSSIAPTAILPPRPAPIDPELAARSAARRATARRLAAELVELTRHHPVGREAETLLDRALEETAHQIGVAAINLGLVRAGG